MRKLIVLLLCLTTSTFASELHDAYASYTVGEHAKTLSERKDAFNTALTAYSEIVTTSPTNGSLYYNIGNCYFQLNEYPQAILYYYKALSASPRHNKAKEHLSIAQGKINIPHDHYYSIIKTLLSFHCYLSKGERFKSIFITCCLALISWSLYIWHRARLWRIIGYIITAMAAILLISVFISSYMIPIEGVVMHASTIRRDAGNHYTPVTDTPLLPGTKVRIVETIHENTWLKIMTIDKDIGYVPNSVIRTINY